MVRYLFYTIGDLTYQSPLVYRMGGGLNYSGLLQMTCEPSGSIAVCAVMRHFHCMPFDVR